MASPYDLSGGAMSDAQYQAMSTAYQRQADATMKELQQKYKLGKDDIAARLKIASQDSKDKRYGIDAQRDSERERIEQARQEMLRIGIPEMETHRFVAESNKALAEQELSLRREIFLADSGLARDQLNKDIEEMRRIGIPDMEIRRYAAEHTAAIQEQEQRLAQQKYQSDASGYMAASPALAPVQQQRMQQLQQRAAGGAAGAAPLTSDEQYELTTLQQQDQAAQANPGGQATLARQTFEQQQLEEGRQYQLDVQRFGADEAERRRRYALDVGKFGAELASTPDTYFQARRFQGVDVPRLMGGAGAATTGPMGGPTPGVATMGAYLSGQDPHATPYGGAAPSGGQGRLAWAGLTPEAQAALTQQNGGQVPSWASTEMDEQVGALGMPGTPEDDRAKQLAQLAKLSPPSPYDGLNEQDTSTLKLMESIYKRGGQSIAGGEYDRLKTSGRLGYLQSAGKILGYDPKELESQYQAYRPQQSAGNLA